MKQAVTWQKLRVDSLYSWALPSKLNLGRCRCFRERHFPCNTNVEFDTFNSSLIKKKKKKKKKE